MTERVDPLAALRELLSQQNLPIESVDELPQRRTDDVLGVNTVLPDIASAETVTIRRRHDAPLNVEVYRPLGTGPFPKLVYLHGGAWYAGSAAGVRRLAQLLCTAGLVVANVDYGLAPELPFPVAVEDALYATRWFGEHGARFGGDAGGVALAGDSAGANIAAAVTARLRPAKDAGTLPLDEGDRAGQDLSVTALALLYGVFDLLDLLAIGSRDKQRLGFHESVVSGYLGFKYLEHITDPLVSPCNADLHGWPPTYLSCGSADTLLPQSLSFTEALATAGVATTLSVVAEAPHGFLQLDQYLPAAAREIARIGEWLREHAGREIVGAAHRPGSDARGV